MKGLQMLKRSKLPMFVLIGFVLSSCTGGAMWMAKKDQETVNSYIEKRIDTGKYDLEGLCDRVRKAEFKSAANPSRVNRAAQARKARRAFEQISQKRGSDVKCPKITADELRVYLHRAERMQADREEAIDALGKVAAGAMGYGGKSSGNSSYNSERLEELERKQKEDKFWRDYDCSNAQWRKGYC